jgi:hypothetical protein
MLEERIEAAEAGMRAKLAETRASFVHPGIKGDHVEAAFRAFLAQYLPRRLTVAHGEVVDKLGNRSAQTDVVVANEDHPFTFTPSEPGLFFVEGVSAVGEVKSVLTSDEFAGTVAKSRLWKKLVMKPGAGTLLHANPSDGERFYKRPPCFLVAMESQLSLETVQQRLAAEGHFGAEGYSGALDAVFLLDRGWAIDFGTGEGKYQFQVSGASAAGWNFRQSDQVLFDMLGWLSACMPKMIQFEPVLLSYLVSNVKSGGPG